MKLKHLIIFFSLSWSLLACSDDNNNPANPPSPNPEEPNQGVDISAFPDGITRISDDSLAFVLFAPGKSSVYLMGDFNDWKTYEQYKMTKDGDRFRIKIGNLDKNREYICQYLIDAKLRIADPYANKVSDPWNDKYIASDVYPNLIEYPTGKTTEIAMVVTTAQPDYQWKVQNFKLDNPDNMVVYELLVRDFTGQGTIKAVKEKIPYLKSLGVNAIELMPFNEFEGNDSWGYNPSFYFATDKAYGTPNDYKAFIDECHANGMAVIMDMVLNHSYGQSPMVRMYQGSNYKVTADNPWYNIESPNTSYSWGYDFNHESIYTQQFVDSVCAYWMKEYKIDGYRFDFTKGFTNTPGDGGAYDAARINILKRMTNEIWKRNADAIVIFEHLTDNSEEKVLAEHGIYLWGNINYTFNEMTMGWGDESGDYNKKKGDISWASYKEREWNKPKLVAYMESHDEERIMFKNNRYGRTEGSYDVKNLATGLERTEAAAVILLTLPGPKMIWQFGEMGYDFSINSDPTGHWEQAFDDGRHRTGRKPVRWDYLDIAERKSLHDVYAKMNQLRTTNPVFSATDYTIDLTGQFKQILLKSAGSYACAVANFDVVNRTATVSFGKAAQWEDYFSGNKITTTSATAQIELQPGEYRLYLSR